MRLKFPIGFTLKNGQRGEITIDTGEVKVESKDGKPVLDYPLERLEAMKKEIAIGALEHAILSPDYPPEILEAIQTTLSNLKAGYSIEFGEW